MQCATTTYAEPSPVKCRGAVARAWTKTFVFKMCMALFHTGVRRSQTRASYYTSHRRNPEFIYGVTTGHYSNFFTQQLKYPRVEVPAGKNLSRPDAEKINWTPKCFKTIAKVVNISVAILADLKLIGVTKLLPVILEYLIYSMPLF